MAIDIMANIFALNAMNGGKAAAMSTILSTIENIEEIKAWWCFNIASDNIIRALRERANHSNRPRNTRLQEYLYLRRRRQRRQRISK